MSRSYRKPYYGNPEGSSHWKKEANKRIRRNKEIEITDGSHYKKENDMSASPMERGYWDVPKMRRK